MADERLRPADLPPDLGDKRPRLPFEERPAEGYMKPEPADVYRQVADPKTSPNRRR
jgi:hypothetical protein